MLSTRDARENREEEEAGKKEEWKCALDSRMRDPDQMHLSLELYDVQHFLLLSKQVVSETQNHLFRESLDPVGKGSPPLMPCAGKKPAIQLLEKEAIRLLDPLRRGPDAK